SRSVCAGVWPASEPAYARRLDAAAPGLRGRDYRRGRDSLDPVLRPPSGGVFVCDPVRSFTAARCDLEQGFGHALPTVSAAVWPSDAPVVQFYPAVLPSRRIRLCVD